MGVELPTSKQSIAVRAGEAFVAKFKREPSTASDAAWLNGYADRDAVETISPQSALEHGEYLAKAVESYRDARNELARADEIGATETQCFHDAVGDCWAAMGRAIHEFRKRASPLKTAAPPVVGWLGRNGEATTAADEVPATPRPVVNATMCGGHSDENGPIDTVVVCPHCGGKVGVESVTLVPTR